MKGSKLLRVSSIITVVFAAISLAGCVITIPVVFFLQNFDWFRELYYDMPNLDSFVFLMHTALQYMLWLLLISLVYSVLWLIAGIVGIRGWNKPQKAQSCFVWGIITIIATVFFTLISLMLVYRLQRRFFIELAIYNISGLSIAYVAGGIIGLAVSLVLPVLYLIGACRNRKLARAWRANAWQPPYGYAPQPPYGCAPQQPLSQPAQPLAPAPQPGQQPEPPRDTPVDRPEP